MQNNTTIIGLIQLFGGDSGVDDGGGRLVVTVGIFLINWILVGATNRWQNTKLKMVIWRWAYPLLEPFKNPHEIEWRNVCIEPCQTIKATTHRKIQNHVHTTYTYILKCESFRVYFFLFSFAILLLRCRHHHHYYYYFFVFWRQMRTNKKWSRHIYEHLPLICVCVYIFYVLTFTHSLTWCMLTHTLERCEKENEREKERFELSRVESNRIESLSSRQPEHSNSNKTAAAAPHTICIRIRGTHIPIYI